MTKPAVSKSPKIKTVSQAKILARLLQATVDTAFKSGPRFIFGIVPQSGQGHRLIFAIGAEQLQAFVDKPLPAEIGRPLGIVDESRALEMMAGYLDSLAADMSDKFTAAESVDFYLAALLHQWSELRAGRGMTAANAQRLFGDAPAVTEVDAARVGTVLRIDWEGPERVLGPRPANYADHKREAQEAFTRAVVEAEERFIGTCHLNYLLSLAPQWPPLVRPATRRKSNRHRSKQ